MTQKIDKAVLMRNIIYYSKYGAILLVLFILFQCWRSYDLKVVPIDNDKMSPRFKPEELLLGKRVHDYEMLDYGDVVYYRYPYQEGKEELCFGRIVGLPGDRISFQEGKLYRNGELQEEQINPEFYGQENMLPLMVPRDYVYILLDNRQRLGKNPTVQDSRSLGPILLATIIGKFEED